MIALIQDNVQQIRALCERFDVRRLELFGSAATGCFDPAQSDIDFLVDLGEYDMTALDRYMGLAEALERLLGYDVDLVTRPTLRNPHFVRSIENARVTLYEVEGRQAAA